MNKVSGSVLNLFLSIISLIVGAIGIKIIGNAFTCESLVESILLICPIVYFILKYCSSYTISQYRDNHFMPGRTRRVIDGIFVNVCVFIVLPICIDFEIASLILLTFKWVAPESLGNFANTIFSIYIFNKTYFKKPIATFILILGVFTLFKIVSKTIFKNIKKANSILAVPIRVICTLLLFVNIDSGFACKYISWKVNQDIPKESSGNFSFNASNEQKVIINKIVTSYVSRMMDQLREGSKKTEISTTTVSAQIFYQSLHKIQENWEKDPEILKEIYEGHAGSEITLEDEDKYAISDYVKKSQFAKYKTTEFKSTELCDEVCNLSVERRNSLLDLLCDNRNSIKEKTVSPNEEILEKMLGDFISHTYFFRELPDNIPFFSFAKDKTFDLIKDKFVDGFSYLIKKAKMGYVEKKDEVILTDYIRLNCKSNVDKVLIKMDAYKKCFNDFSNQYTASLELKKRIKPTGQTTSKVLKEYTIEFPTDAQSRLYGKMIPLYEFNETRDVSKLFQIDIQYFKNKCYDATLEGESPEYSKLLREFIHKLEMAKDFEACKIAAKSENWELFLKRYPDAPLRRAIEQNIKIIQENKAVSNAIRSNSEGAWNELLEQYPNNSDYKLLYSYWRNEEFALLNREGESLVIGNAARMATTIAEESLFSELVNALGYVHF